MAYYFKLLGCPGRRCLEGAKNALEAKQLTTRLPWPCSLDCGMPTSWTYRLLGCSGDLVSRLSDWPYGASYGFIWGLVRDPM